MESLKSGLQSAGIEIYRVREGVIEVAERIRFHIMDSGVRVVPGDSIEIVFSARSQKSGNPDLDDESLFALVRSALSEVAGKHGFVETGTSSEKVVDPIDASRVLDVWYEVSFSRRVQTVEEAADLVRWILTVERFVGASAPPDGGQY